MFIELIDLLRCPVPHRDSWLVARMDRVEDRRIVTGALGCPVCHAEYAIENGIVYFVQIDPPADSASDTDIAMRLAAGLGLVAPSNVAVLHGVWGTQATLVRALAPAQLLLVNPPANAEAADGISIVRAATAPFASAAVDAAAIDPSASDELRRALVRSVRAGGRVLSRQALTADHNVTELLATDDVWIGEVKRASPTVPLLRLARRPEKT